MSSAEREADLLEKASALAGRQVEVGKLRDGSYAVVYMAFGKKPPQGKTRDEALELFIKFMTFDRPVDPGTDEDFKALQDGLEAEKRGLT